MPASPPRILLDLDCVLADFVSGAAAAFGLTVADLEPHWPAGQYGLEHVLARALAWTDKADRPASDAPTFGGRMWAGIEARPGFWVDLPELPWARELIDLVRSTTPDWWVVTSPSRCPRCIPEKREWVNRVFGVEPGQWFDRLIPTPHKELMAVRKMKGKFTLTNYAVPNVLIDDYDANIDRFEAAGGVGVLFPAHHNRLHELKANPMRHVRESLDQLLNG